MSPALEKPFPISVDEAMTLRARGEPVAFVDSRNPIAWGSSKVKLPGARRVPVDEVERHLASFHPDQHLVVYCT